MGVLFYLFFSLHEKLKHYRESIRINYYYFFHPPWPSFCIIASGPRRNLPRSSPLCTVDVAPPHLPNAGEACPLQQHRHRPHSAFSIFTIASILHKLTHSSIQSTLPPSVCLLHPSPEPRLAPSAQQLSPPVGSRTLLRPSELHPDSCARCLLPPPCVSVSFTQFSLNRKFVIRLRSTDRSSLVQNTRPSCTHEGQSTPIRHS